MQADKLTDGIAAALSHPVTVQVVNQGPGIWGNVATGLITAGAAIIAVMLTHRFTLHREKLAADKKIAREVEVQNEKDERDRFFLSTELIFILEKFGEECVPPATDYRGVEDESGCSVPESHLPEISFAGVKADWRSLPPLLMYRLRELEVMLAESHNLISAAFRHDDPPFYSEAFFRRQQQAVRLGIRAFVLSAKLRKRCGMPAMNQAGNISSAPDRLWQQYRELRLISIAARRNRTTLDMEIARTAYYKRECE